MRRLKFHRIFGLKWPLSDDSHRYILPPHQHDLQSKLCCRVTRKNANELLFQIWNREWNELRFTIDDYLSFIRHFNLVFINYVNITLRKKKKKKKKKKSVKCLFCPKTLCARLLKVPRFAWVSLPPAMKCASIPLGEKDQVQRYQIAGCSYVEACGGCFQTLPGSLRKLFRK